MSGEIVNKVANSGLQTIDLEEYFPKGKRVLFDMKTWLFEEMFLKEKDFRESAKNHDWSQYKNQHVAVECSVEAIIPVWAYMLISSYLSPYASTIVKGKLNTLETILFDNAINQINFENYRNQRVIIKGCSNLEVCDHAYALITTKLIPVAKSVMYGEACSSVPIFKRK